MDVHATLPSGGEDAPETSERLAALQRYDILDTPPEEAFDRITDLAASLFGVPIALITFIDAGRQWHKSSVGLDVDEVPFGLSFCRHVVEGGHTMMVEDVTEDERFVDNPFVTDEPGVRFYAAAPLTTPSGVPIGTLSVFDVAPQSPPQDRLEQLEDLAAMVVDELELRREVAERKRTESRRRLQNHILERVAEGASLHDVLTDLVVAIEERRSDMIGSVQLYDRTENRIRHAAAPHLPDAYNRAIDGVEVGPNAGSCGTAMHSESTIIVEDIATDPRWADYKELAREHDLRACWSRPIRGTEGEVLGTFAMYYREPTRPSEADRVLIDEAASLARIAIERHHDVRALQNTKERHRRFMDESPVGIYRTTPDGEILYANDALVEMLGFSSFEELASRDLEEEGFAEGDREDFKAEMQAHGSVNQRETGWMRADGQIIHVLESAHVAEEDGQTVYVGVVEDITERKEREDQLRMLSEAVEQAQEAICITGGPELGDPGPPIVYVNSAFERVTGYSEDEILGRPPEILEASETDPAVIERREKRLRAGQTFTGDIVCCRKDGSTYVARWTIAPVRGADHEIEHWVGVHRDVTEEREREETLRQQRNLLEQTQRLAGAWAVNLRTGELSWTEEVYRIHELPVGAEVTVDEAIGFYAPEDRPMIRKVYRHAIETGEGWNLELSIVTAEGNRRWVRTVGTAIEENGSVIKVVGAFQDITEREERKRQLETLIQNVPGMVYRCRNEPGWPMEVVKGECEELTGYSAEALEAGDVSWGEEILHPEDRDAMWKAVQNALDAGEPFEVTYRIRTKDGQEKWMWERGRGVYTDGELCALEGLITDITERKKAEEELRRSQERWRSLVEKQQDGLQISVDEEIRYVNPAGAEILGVDAPEDVIGEPIDRFLTSDEVRADMEDRAEQLDRGEPTEPYEHEIEGLDGERRIVESYSVPIEYRGEEAAQTVVRDVTDQKHLDEQLRRAQKMETVGTLAGGIAHDFNNILHAVASYVELGRRDLPESHLVHTYLSRAEKGLQQARELVRKLLTFGRPEESATQRPVDLVPLVEDTLDLVRPSLPHDLVLRTQLEENCVVMGDEGQLQQVVMNLVTNAGQAMEAAEQEDAGSGASKLLKVEVQSVDVGSDLADRYLNLETGRYVHLLVSDTGPGMTEKTKERIFDPFFTTKEVSKGTGLGLAVVHGAVQVHNGEITVYTQPGEGTTFNVYLPASGQDEQAEDVSPDESERVKGHVLVVDDDTSVLDLERIRISRFGYEVTTINSAHEAVEAVRARPEAYDVTLTDYMMPEMNGVALARALRDAGYEGPLVLMTGFSAQMSREEALDAGMSAFLQKPVESHRLSETLDQLVE